MATGTIILPILAAIGDPTAPPGLLFTATNNRPYLAFDNTIAEYVVWSFRLPVNYANTPVLKIQWSASAASAPGSTVDTVQWSCAAMAVTPELDAVSVLTESFGTADTQLDDADNTTARKLMEASMSLTLDSPAAAASDYLALRFGRPVYATERLASDAWLWGLSLEYVTT